MTDHADTIRNPGASVAAFDLILADLEQIVRGQAPPFPAYLQPHQARIIVREVGRLRAERQQAIDERDAALAALKDELQWDFGGPGAKRIEQLETRCEQAIDALREIEALPPEREDECRGRARAALVKLGEQP